jgi:hypothetical protein
MRERNTVAAAWLVAVAAGGVAIVGVAIAQPPTAADPKPPAKAQPAKPADPLGAMLADARTAYGKMRDYSGTFTRQEQINGVLGAEQVGEIKARVSPFGVYVRFARPEAAAGMEVAYSAAKRDGRVRYRPAGVAGRKGFLKLEPDDPKFLADHRHPATEWGIGAVIELIARSTAREKSLNNPVEVFTADYQFANRNVTRYEIATRRPHALRYAAKMVVYVDKETKLPVRFEAYNDPKPGATAGELLEAYSFTDLKFNTGIGENVFDY